MSDTMTFTLPASIRPAISQAGPHSARPSGAAQASPYARLLYRDPAGRAPGEVYDVTGGAGIA
jgi:hypothetical protein